MSTKSILNKTSRKKRDTMLSVSNTTATGAYRALAPGSLIVPGNSNAACLWMATARDLQRDGGLNTITDLAGRTSQTCYMRGLSEKLRIQTNSAVPWIHRRICFTLKGDAFVATYSGDSALLTRPYNDVSGTGMRRVWQNLSVVAASGLYNALVGAVFKGASGTDWSDVFTAPIDNSRVTIKYDKTRTYSSGNQAGFVKRFNMWHPMNKNLVYDDDEQGETNTTSYRSTEGKAGMGDYYVLDFFSPGGGRDATDLLQVSTDSTLYWHEK